MKPLVLVAATLPFLAQAAMAEDLEIQPVVENVYALVGTLQQRNPENFGNNATFGVIVTPEGVVLVDAGASWKGAAQIDTTIDQITDQPVKYVINTGGQDHRWLGNGYFRESGARIIAGRCRGVGSLHRVAARALASASNGAMKGSGPASLCAQSPRSKGLPCSPETNALPRSSRRPEVQAVPMVRAPCY